MSAPAIAYYPDPAHWDRDFEYALHAYEQGEHDMAMKVANRIVSEGSQNPLHLSFAGLLLSQVARNQKEARRLCIKALEMGFLEGEIYLNLAQVLQADCDTKGAIEALRRGLRAIPGEPRMIARLKELSPRRTPAFSMLSRGHWLNHSLGRLLSKFG